MALSWSLDKIGPICRSASDAAIVFAFIHGTDGVDPSAINARFNYQPSSDARQLRIGYTKNYFDRIKDTTRSEWKVLRSFQDAGYTLIPVDFPDSAAYPFNIMDVVISAEAAAAFDDFTRNNIDDEMTRICHRKCAGSFLLHTPVATRRCQLTPERLGKSASCRSET